MPNDEEKKLALTNINDEDFWTDHQTLTFKDYTLVNYKGSNLSSLWTIHNFPKLYQRWQVNRLPLFAATENLKAIVCPWCGKPSGLSGLHKDHIVPVQKYIRYCAYLDAKKSVEKDGHHADRHIKNLFKSHRKKIYDWYNQKENVILCCAPCNLGFGDDLKTRGDFNKAKKNYEDNDEILTKLNWAEATTRDLKKLIGTLSDGPFVNYIDKGISGWVPRSMQTDGKADETGRQIRKDEGRIKILVYESDLDSDDDSDDEPDEEYDEAKEIRRLLSDVHMAHTDLFVKNRPMWRIDREELLKAHLPADVAKTVGRVCFYCLGVSDGGSFQLDHIVPFSWGSAPPGLQNHIPVCSRCNSKKSANALSGDFFEKRQKERIALGIPSLVKSMEMSTGRRISKADAEKKRLKLLGKIK